MRKYWYGLGAALILPFFVHAQLYILSGDSLMRLLQTRFTSPGTERMDVWSELLNRHLPETAAYDSVRNEMISEAEGTRNRVLMCYTYVRIAASYLGYYVKPEFFEKGQAYATRCLQIATSSGLNEYKVAAYLLYARYYLNLSNHQEALNYNNQAIALASSMGSDSLMSLAYGSVAQTWDQMANKLSSFQALLNAREFADRSGIHSLILNSWFDLGSFYESTGDYEKSKDYYTECIRDGKEWRAYMVVFNATRAMARCFISQSNERLGLDYYNKALQYADSLGMDKGRLQIYLDVLNYYFNARDPVVGFGYLKAHPELSDFIRQFGIEYQINKLYAVLESSRQHYDSALYFLHMAAPFEFGQTGNFSEKFNFTMQMAAAWQAKKNYEEEKKYLLRARAYADSSQNLYQMKDAVLNLDSVSQTLGDYRAARTYLSEYVIYKDSLQTLSKQKDLLNIEIDNANKRAELQKKKQEEATRVRNNLEYMGITAALATVFIILVLLGVFKISPAVIRALGFFAFIFLFEFIVLLLDKQIEEITRGEPWKVLGVKIVIIGMLLPLHHWLEDKMLHYLTFKAHTIRSKFAPRKMADKKE